MERGPSLVIFMAKLLQLSKPAFLFLQYLFSYAVVINLILGSNLDSQWLQHNWVTSNTIGVIHNMSWPFCEAAGYLNCDIPFVSIIENVFAI